MRRGAGVCRLWSASTSSCRAAFPRSPLFYDPVPTPTWVAAVTKWWPGTSVLVLPMRHPLLLAKEPATLHNLSEGRLIPAPASLLQAGVCRAGRAVPRAGRRMDEGIAMMRAVWTQDPVSFRGKHIAAEVEEMTMLPMPISRIPIWIGGSSDAALKRTMWW